MKYFPRYRVYSIIGWVLPIILSYYVSTIPDIHWIFKLFLFLFLCPVFFIGIIAIYLIVGKLWNRRKRNSKEDSEASCKE